MATKNDFEILNHKCKRYFELAQTEGAIQKELEIEDKEQQRFGFYYLILMNILSLDDFSSITDIITDTDFRSKIENKAYNDEGIDAVYIDEINKTISLFNFKFREKWNADKVQSLDEVITSSKYFNVLHTENNTLKGILKKKTATIIKKLNSDEEWDINLYVISNENKTLDESMSQIKNLQEANNIDVKCLGLDEISKIISSHPDPVSSEIIVSSDSILSYIVNKNNSEKSYTLCVRLLDLLRITCNDKKLRNKTHLDNEDTLFNVNIEMSVLYENVRGYILKSKYNNNILNTLENEPSKFFYYNNGLTIVADNIVKRKINHNKKVKITIDNFQVINGGQTLRTIHKFIKQDEKNIKKIANSCVQVRLIKVDDDDFKNKISEYTNSQNAISVIDLKSMRKEQIALEQYLADNDILYIRKSGDSGLENKEYQYCITLQKLGQILYAVKGNPGQVSNKKQQIFTSEYENLFCTDELLSNKTITYIKKYFAIKNIYQTLPNYFELKIFFVLYLSVKLDRSDFDKLIQEFDGLVDTFSSTKLKPSRRLIQPTFLDNINNHFSIQ